MYSYTEKTGHKMTNQELIDTLNTASESAGGNIALSMLLKIAADRILELDDRCDELAADKGTYFRLYEALCIKVESDKRAKV
jgi:hypothetical protein